ncbi:putative pectinesterase/pectinesterase inhibitor 51 [Drosera capensis]
MATLFPPLLLLLFLLPFSSSSRHHHVPITAVTVSPTLQHSCNATRFPESCLSTLGNSPDLPSSPTSHRIIQESFRASARSINAAQSLVTAILNSSPASSNRSKAASTCLDVLGYSETRVGSAASAIWEAARVKDARAWASAALAYQYDCWSGLKYVNETTTVADAMRYLNDTLIVETSNALSMVVALDVYGNDTSLWVPPRTERDGFWEGSGGGSGSGLGFEGGFPSGLTPNATVCKDGGVGADGNRCYVTVQEAVETVPGGLTGRARFVIYIKEGVYEETVRVPFEKTNVVFVGDGMGRSVITGSLNTGLLGITTYLTATVGVLGDGFMAYGLTFQNTAGPDAHQAVAFRSDSDLSYIENCEFLGNQDTLYVHSLRQLYKSCHIQGNVDFIFGAAAAVFQDCTILVRPRQVKPEKGETNTITAHGRIDPAQSVGFAFLGCVINGTDDYMKLYYSKPSVHKNYLGRPWKQYSRTVFINCTLGDLISPDGWSPWSGDFALSTLYYGEYGNSGAGADLSMRVSWSSRIPANHIYTYSVQNFIQGNELITSSSLSKVC